MILAGFLHGWTFPPRLKFRHGYVTVLLAIFFKNVYMYSSDYSPSVINGDDLYPVRLVNGSTIYEGRVEIKRNGVWGRVCDSLWDINDAYVVCRLLGYGTAKNATVGVHFPPGSGEYWLDNVWCGGWESRLSDCAFDGWGVISGCGDGNSAAGVICQAYEPTDAVTIHLSGSSNSFEGRVSLFKSGAWGTICKDNWDLDEARVACLQLGFEGAQLAVDAKIWSSGSHNDPVYLAGLHCQGTETNLAQCARDDWTDDRCSGYHGDAGVICESENTPAEGDLRLAGSSTSGAGRLEVYHHGIWGTICDDNWTDNEARVACRQLGYDGVTSTFDYTDYGRSTSSILLDNLFCTGREARLSQCPHNGWGEHNCNHLEDVAIACKTSNDEDQNGNISPSMSTTIGAIITCLVVILFVSLCIRYLHQRQKASHAAQQTNQIANADSETTPSPPLYPRANSGLFVVNGIPIDPNLPPRDLEPPDYSSGQWKPAGVPHEPPPSYEVTVAHYPEARTEGVSSPRPPVYSDVSQTNNLIISTSRQSDYPNYTDPADLPGYIGTETPPSSPLPPAD
ncbi:CD5 antigen-like [Asterias amurensis]|uniref:CD5 antigen-like n=1 Tax=Asterias amurensis TaxID=7602 RepID=UPI003AB61749